MTEYLGWQDFAKKPSRDKIEEALERYRAKFGKEPDTVLVSAVDYVEYPGMDVQVAPYIRPCCYWIGKKEATA